MNITRTTRTSAAYFHLASLFIEEKLFETEILFHNKRRTKKTQNRNSRICKTENHQNFYKDTNTKRALIRYHNNEPKILPQRKDMHANISNIFVEKDNVSIFFHIIA